MADIGDFEKWSKSAAKAGKSWERITKSTEKTVDGVAGTVGAVLGMPDRINGERQERRGYGNAMEGRANQAEMYRRQTEEQLRGYQRQDESRQQHGAEQQQRSGVYTEQGGAVVDADRYAQAGPAAGAPAQPAPRSPEQLRSDFIDAITYATKTRDPNALEAARAIGAQLRNPETGKIEIPPGREEIGREAVPGYRGKLPAVNFSDFNNKFDSVDQAIQQLSKVVSPSRAVDAPPLNLNAPMTGRQPVVFRPGQEPQTLPTAPAEDPKAVYADFIRKVAKSEKTGEPLEVAGLPVNKEGLVVFPAGKYATGQLDDKGKPIVVEIKGSEEERSVDQTQALNFAKARVKEAGVAVAAAPAAPAPAKDEPAPDAPPRATPTAAPAAPAPAATELPAADLKSPKAKSYNVAADQMPDGLKQNQVVKLQEMLEKAGAVTGATASDGKYGPKTHDALKKACERAGVDFKAVNFADPKDPELIKLTAKLNEEAAAKAAPGKQAEAPAQSTAASAAELAAQRAAQADTVDSIAAPAVAQPAGPAVEREQPPHVDVARTTPRDVTPDSAVPSDTGMLAGASFGDLSQVQPSALTFGAGLLAQPAPELSFSQLAQPAAPTILTDAAPAPTAPVEQPAPQMVAPAQQSPILTTSSNALFSGASFGFGDAPATFEQASAPTLQPAVLQQQGQALDGMQAALEQARQSSLAASISGGQSTDGIQNAGTAGGVKRETGGIVV